MKTILDLIVEELKPAFTGCGYDEKYIRVTVSNRPDLCEYQCNGAMAAAKAYKKKPIDIANGVVEQLKDRSILPMRWWKRQPEARCFLRSMP